MSDMYSACLGCRSAGKDQSSVSGIRQCKGFGPHGLTVREAWLNSVKRRHAENAAVAGPAAVGCIRELPRQDRLSAFGERFEV